MTKTKSKKIIGIVIGAIIGSIILSMMSCCLLGMFVSDDTSIESDTGISSLTTKPINIEEFYTGMTSEAFELTVTSSTIDYTEKDVNVIIEDPSLIAVEYALDDSMFSTGFTFTIKALKPGTTTFYFETSDQTVKSEPVEITVKQNITAITFSDTEDIIFSSWNDEETKMFDIEAFDATLFETKDLEFVSENPNVATIEYDSSSLFGGYWCNITKVGDGETYVYIQATNGDSVKSEKIKIIVEPEENATTLPETEEAIQTPTEIETESIDDNDSNEYIYTTESYEEPTEAEKSGITVYTTPTGKKYHYSAACAGKNAIAHDLDDVSGSYGPCKKCAQ